MDIKTQMKNAAATQKYFTSTMKNSQPMSPGKPMSAKEAAEVAEHQKNLQELSNGNTNIPYSKTLRIVSHEGAPANESPGGTNRLHPGYIRNAMGGFFTS
eukprot:jgi/Mesvir1/2846/Mv13932-RA.1